MTRVLAAVAMIVATALHLYVFAHESILFTRPATQRMLEVEPQHAAAVRLWAFHQGVYNALLAGAALVGAVALLAGDEQLGLPLTLPAAVSMIAAAFALLVADRRRARVPGFLAQALPAAIALALLAVPV